MSSKRIPISAAAAVGREHGQRQVLLVTWDGERTHVVTWGANVEECRQAAAGGNAVKRALGWPDEACHAATTPRRSRKPSGQTPS